MTTNPENEYLNIIKHSSYYDTEKCHSHIKNYKNKNCFNMLSSNIQCLNSKFNELKIFIEELRETHNFEFSLLCLQECQFNENDDVTQFKLNLHTYSTRKTKNTM